MRFRMTGIVLLSAVVFVAAAEAQTPPAPSAITRTVSPPQTTDRNRRATLF
jgi:hypothetical protein